MHLQKTEVTCKYCLLAGCYRMNL
ncbi:hypothetical protein OIU77_029863 [Salix suchowensis]|uniref:Uncharacterized protein n=1 Tax=Salix suchowensis TaxID=1278906 RepID=A0ABQ9BBQ3_9ROSI|nr:hypothetical protein OIU78_003473 [Salix suchowensis]KAJ6381047.1 hypothetical protein OIU77_029863 [Salix suchowensis]